MDNVLDFTKRLALGAGKILMGYFQTSGMKQSYKEDHTVVTEADLASDRLIRKKIDEAFPEDGILSEEEKTTFPTGKNFVWIIDPLDGTTNFSLGLHYWGVLITRNHNGIPVLSVLYFPILNELYTVVKGKGAYLNGRNLKIDSGSKPRRTTFFSCCSRTHRNYQVEIPYKARILGSAGYGLSTIARGSAVLALEVSPKVWDFSGCVLLIEEAGGYIAPLDGGSLFPLQPGMDYKNQSFSLLAASSKNMWDFGKQHLKPR